MKKIIWAILVTAVLLGLIFLFNSRNTSYPSSVTGPGDFMREVPGWSGRPYELHIPSSYTPDKSFPVVLLLHGGGGNSSSATRITCPEGDVSSPLCLRALADREGFIIVSPNGTAALLRPNARTWNAGGGKNGYLCSTGLACLNNVDDVGYVRAVLDDLASIAAVDPKRTYSVGLSNGGSMTYRLGCELSGRIAAITDLASGNQFSTSATCAPLRPVPVLHIHGTEDPLFPYEGGEAKNDLQNPGIRISVAESLGGWVKRNNCFTTPHIEKFVDNVDDGTTVERHTYSPCAAGADVVHYKITGGGHTWPQGFSYANETLIGKTSQEFSANEVIWAFFKAHPMP